MTPLAPLPDDLFAGLPPAAQAYIRLLERTVRDLQQRVADLEERLNRDASNSSLPPSAAPLHAKPAPPRKPSGKAKGGQPGHPRAERALLPPDVVVALKPDRCRACRRSLQGDDPEPLVCQVHELPEVRPHVTEYRRHRLACPGCGKLNCPELPAAAQSGYGPRVQAAAAMLSGACRLGKRAVAQALGDLYGLAISPAAVCDLERRTAAALQPVAAEALEHVRDQPANVDETSWKQGSHKAWLWAAVTNCLSVFQIRLSRSRDAFEDLMGDAPGVLTTDRYAVYAHLAPERRQVCWAHLRRDFQAMIDRQNAGSVIGAELLFHADVLFDLWERVRDGTLSRRGFRGRWLPGLRGEVESLLARGEACGCAKTAGTCRELRALEPSLWTFARVEGVEPTNNAAERAVRHAVCWRKTSYGTDSESGSRFVERILTVVGSCRQQGRNVLAFLSQAIQAARNGGETPSLLPQGA